MKASIIVNKTAPIARLVISRLKNTINEELLEIIKALSAKIESLEKAVYNDDNLLMKSGFVVVDSPTPKMNHGTIGGSPLKDVGNMDWKDIHKMVEKVGGQ